MGRPCWSPWLMVPDTRTSYLEHTVMRPPAPNLRFFFATFRLPAPLFSILVVVFSFKGHVTRPNPSPFHSPFSIFFSLGVVLEREGEVKTTRNPCRVCDRKIEARFWLSFLFLLFSFLALVLCFVISDLNL